MKIVVTGGAGFIGSHIVDALRQRDIEVIIFDRHKCSMHRDDFEFVVGDVKDKKLVDEIIKSSDGVIHLAATLGTQETINRPKYIVDTNIKGSLNVFFACRNYNTRAVYIAVGNHWMNNPYSITKTAAERFALMFNTEFGSKIAVVRGLNAYGPRQKQFPVRKIMPNLVIPALKNEQIIVYGSGNQIMDMIYVEDLAEILVRALLNDHGAYGRAIEAGMGEDTTVNHLVDIVVKMASSRAKVDHVAMRPGEIPDSIVKADTSTLEQIGWKKSEFTPLEVGIKKTIEWYKQSQLA